MIRVRTLALLSLTTLFLACGPSSAPTDCSAPTELTSASVSGGVTLAKACYAVKATVEVTGGTLTLKPGVIIQFANNTELAVLTDGRLHAVGTAADPILFKGEANTPGYWAGVTFMNSKGPENDLEYVTFENGGGPAHLNGIDNTTGALAVYGNSQVKMVHGMISGSTTSGFSARGELDLEQSTITANDFPGQVSPNNVAHLGTTNHLTGNTHDELRIWSSSPIGPGVMDHDTTFAALDVPYGVRDGFTVSSNTTLTIDPGVTLRMATQQGLAVQDTSRLVINGTSAQPVTISSYDGVAGSWAGIHLESPANELHYATLTDGGSLGDWAHANLHLAGAASVAVDNITVANSSGWGIGMETSGTLTGCATVTFSGNVSGDVYPDKTATDCI